MAINCNVKQCLKWTENIIGFFSVKQEEMCRRDTRLQNKYNGVLVSKTCEKCTCLQIIIYMRVFCGFYRFYVV